jgi:G:T-mismatch repair DNA endonuclease (very short patch repair protein)
MIKKFCHICQKEIGTYSHISKKHKISFQIYFDKFLRQKEDGFCIICNQPTSWNQLLMRYNKLCSKKCRDKYGIYNFNNTLNFWIKKGFNEEESKKQVCYVQDQRREKMKLKYKQGLIANNVHSTQIGYWIKKGFTEEDAKLKVKERQSTFSKKICIEKYGEKEGLKKWEKRQEKWQETLNNKSQEEINEINKKRISNGFSISKNEIKIFNFLIQQGFQLQHSQTIKNKNNQRYIVDFVFKNKIIEYNGDYWHCNPSIYSPTYFNKRIHQTAQEKWIKDKKRIEDLKNMGYIVLVVWEHDFKNEKEKTLTEIINFLSQKGNSNESS